MIPQHQHGAVGRVGAYAPGHKVLQRAAPHHVLRAQVSQFLELAACQLEALDGLPAGDQARRVGLVGPSRGDDDAGVGRALRGQHLQQVAGAQVAATLQIGTQQVNEHRGAERRAGVGATAAAGGKPSSEQGGGGAKHVAA